MCSMEASVCKMDAEQLLFDAVCLLGFFDVVNEEDFSLLTLGERALILCGKTVTYSENAFYVYI
jgi:hypothetical protein